MTNDPESRVFISYRSEDTGETASRLCRDLERAFGKHCVFLDQDGLEGATNWPERLRTEVRHASVVLLLIGRQWLSIHDPNTGDRRLNLPDDWVRLEIEEAIKAERDIIPVLVEGARPLTQVDLRTIPSISSLADLQAITLRRKDWDSDFTRVIALLIPRGFHTEQRASR